MLKKGFHELKKGQKMLEKEFHELKKGAANAS